MESNCVVLVGIKQEIIGNVDRPTSLLKALTQLLWRVGL